MATTGCGCKICKANLGEFTNELILNGESPKNVLKALQERNIKVTEKLLKKHLSAYEIYIPDKIETEESYTGEPIKVDLNRIDFSEYDFEVDDMESIVRYLQKINLKIYLNQSKITLQAQEDVINGKSPDIPKEILQNLAVAFQILDKSTGISTYINQQEAIKVVEAMGLIIQKPNQNYISYVQNSTESETN
jgi:hypothetical protein